MNKYPTDQIVTTRDGKQHRVIYQSGNKLMVRTLCDKKKRMIEVSRVVR